MGRRGKTEDGRKTKETQHIRLHPRPNGPLKLNQAPLKSHTLIDTLI